MDTFRHISLAWRFSAVYTVGSNPLPEEMKMLPTVKSQVSLPADVAKYLRELGHGRLSAGILFLTTQAMQSSTPAAQTGKPTATKPLTSSQLKDRMRREQSRNQAVAALQVYAEREGLTADSPDLLGAVEQFGLGITVDDIVPARDSVPVTESVDAILSDWVE